MKSSKKKNSAPKPIIYYDNWLHKKEGVKTWVQYYSVIRGKWLQFYEKNGERLELRKTLELSEVTQCSLVKKSKRRFPFSVNNGMGTYYMKCETELERYHWIVSILSAALAKDKKPLPKIVPKEMSETQAFSKHAKENDDPKKSSPTESNSSSSTPTNSPTKHIASAADFHNKRRQKFAIRNENRMKRKAAKKARKLGLDPPEEQTAPTEKSSGVLRRTKNVRPASSSHVTSDDSNVTRLQAFSQTSIPEDPRDQDEEIPTLKSILRDREPSSPTNIRVHALVNSRPKKKVSIGDSNFGFEDDDIRNIPEIPVHLHDSDELLPNVILYDDYSDSDTDDDSANTADTSLASRTDSVLSISGNSVGLTSRTFLSTDRSEDFEQRSIDGQTMISSPMNQRIRSKSPLRPGSNNSGRLMPPDNILDGPLTPSHKRPITPKKQFSRFLVTDQSTA